VPDTVELSVGRFAGSRRKPWRLLAATALSLALALAPTVAAQGIPGDADGSGAVGSGDVTAILDAILAIHPAPGNPDCTGDGTVNVLDVICVQQIIVATVPSITDFQPRSAKPGTVITLQGSHLSVDGVPPVVTLARRGGGSLAAPVTTFSAGSAAFLVPPGAATGLVTVTLPERPSAVSAQLLAILSSSGFSLTASPSAVPVVRGQSAASTVTLASSDGFAQLAELAVSGLPSGVSAAFDPPRIAAGQTAVLTLSALAAAPVGTMTISVFASALVDGTALEASASISLTVRPVSTSFLGRVVVADPLQTPLAGVTVALIGVNGQGNPTGCSGQTVTDAAGNFALTDLPAACVGDQMVRLDGTLATSPPGVYAAVDKLMTLTAGVAFSMPVPFHLPRINNSELALVRQNHPTAQTFTFQTIPDLNVTVPAGTFLTMPDGSRPDPFPLLAVQVPIDRLPGPMPPNSSTLVPFIVAFQPARAEASKPMAVYFPNAIGTRPGTSVTLITLDPTRGIMVPYGTGTISANGRQIVPNFDPAHPGLRYGLTHLGWHGPVQPPPPAVSPAPPGSGVCPVGVKPVDPASGLDVVTETDLTLPGLRGGGLAIVRTFRNLFSESGPFGQGGSHNYDYRLDTSVPQALAVINLILPDGNRLPFTRGASGTLTNSTIPDLAGAVLTVASDNSAQLRFKQGTVLRFIPVDFQSGSVLASITDSYGNRTSFVRPASRLRRIDEILDPVGRRLRFTYDANDRITSITDPIGRTVSYTYFPSGLLETVTDPESGVTRYAYDAQNRLTQVTDARNVVVASNTYDANGRVIEQVQADGGRWAFSYILVNPQLPSSPVQETTVTDPLGRRTVYRFNPQGFLLDVTDPLGQTRVFEREPGTNRLLAVRGVAGCDVCGAPSAGDETYSYDGNGNLLTRTDALGRTFTWTWDPAVNQPATVTDPLNHERQYIYGPGGVLLTATDENGHATVLSYDTFGQPVEITDPAGKVWQIGYDGYGNPVRMTDPLGNATLLRYDAVSRLLETVDPLGRSTRYTYDRLNRLTETTDALGHVTRFTYDAVGNLLSVTDARNHATSFTYDAMGRAATRTDPLGHVSGWTYDFLGNVTRFEDRRGRVADFTYDGLDRLVREQYPDATVDRVYDPRGRLLRVEDSAGGVFTYSYDLAGDLLRAEGPTGAIEYTRDDLGRISRRQVVGQPPLDLTYDPAGNLLSAALPPISTAFNYDERDQPIRQTRSNGVLTDYGYDVMGRILSLIDSRGAQTINTQTYTYDAASQRMSHSNALGQPLETQPSVNIIDPQSDRMLQRGAVTYTYDEEGNRLTEMAPSGMTSYTWDSRGRLATISFSGGMATFRYDYGGNLIEKTISGRTESYVLDELTNVAYQEDSSGLRMSMLSGPRIDQHFGIVKTSGGVELGLRDAINSTVATVDETGALKGQFAYEPYGKMAMSGSTVSPFRFTGRTLATGNLYYYRARYYDPAAARFVSEDPIGFAGRDFNLYRYVGNSPVMFLDPLGYESHFFRDLVSALQQHLFPGLAQRGKAIDEVCRGGNCSRGEAAVEGQNAQNRFADSLPATAGVVSSLPTSLNPVEFVVPVVGEEIAHGIIRYREKNRLGDCNKK
jgi:RHS repeat-associated protein